MLLRQFLQQNQNQSSVNYIEIENCRQKSKNITFFTFDQHQQYDQEINVAYQQEIKSRYYQIFNHKLYMPQQQDCDLQIVYKNKNECTKHPKKNTQFENQKSFQVYTSQLDSPVIELQEETYLDQFSYQQNCYEYNKKSDLNIPIQIRKNKNGLWSVVLNKQVIIFDQEEEVQGKYLQNENWRGFVQSQKIQEFQRNSHFKSKVLSSYQQFQKQNKLKSKIQDIKPSNARQEIPEIEKINVEKFKGSSGKMIIENNLDSKQKQRQDQKQNIPMKYQKVRNDMI